MLSDLPCEKILYKKEMWLYLQLEHIHITNFSIPPEGKNVNIKYNIMEKSLFDFVNVDFAIIN